MCDLSPEELEEIERDIKKYLVASGNFDVDGLVRHAREAISSFAEKHRDLLFYGFAIDANLLCLNTVQDFESDLAEYRKRWPTHYESEESILGMKWNTGDWAYQGFAEFNESSGFSEDAYDFHYNYVMGLVMEACEQPGYKGYGPFEIPDGAECTDYARSMDEVIRRLHEERAFDCLQRTSDFRAIRVEHSY